MDNIDQDPINPQHYRTKSGMQPIDVIRHFELSFSLGNAVKYVLRQGKKHKVGVEDLRKAIWYIREEITHKGYDPDTGQKLTS